MISLMTSRLAGTVATVWRQRHSSRFGTLWVLAALATLVLPGCSDPRRAHAVDVPQARVALKIALDEWKKGESPRSLATSSTPMVVQDFEWASGAKLVDYQLLDDGKAEDANLRVQAKLSLRSGPGPSKITDKKVWYLVGTSPQVTVFRDMLRR